MRACAPAATSSAERVHRVHHVLCCARLAEHVRSSASATKATVAFRVEQFDCVHILGLSLNSLNSLKLTDFFFVIYQYRVTEVT